MLNERVEFVRECEHDVEVWDWQQVFNLLLQPLSSMEPLATGAMAIAAGVRNEVFLAAVGTLILMTTQRRCVTGGDGAKDLPVMSRQAMSLGEVRQSRSHDFPQSDGFRRSGLRVTGHATS